MYGYIYKVSNNVNDKIYIGKHKGIFDITYLGSGVGIINAVNKLGKENFNVELIEYVYSLEEANSREKYWISFYKDKDVELYNKGKGGEGGDITTLLSSEKYELWKQHCCEKSYFVHCTDEQRAAMLKKSYESRKKGKGWKWTEEQRIRSSISHTGYKHSEEAKRKMSRSRLGHVTSEETKKKISKSNRGKKQSVEARNKMHVSWKKLYDSGYANPFKGKHHTQESKNKISKSCLSSPHAGGRGSIWMHNSSCNKRVWQEDVQHYESLGYVRGRLRWKDKESNGSSE